MQVYSDFLIFILFSSCSFDNKSGIWSGSKKEKKRVSELEKEQSRIIDVVKVYTSETFFSKEIPAVKSVNLTKPKTNSFWKMSGLNLQNFVGNIYFKWSYHWAQQGHECTGVILWRIFL